MLRQQQLRTTAERETWATGESCSPAASASNAAGTALLLLPGALKNLAKEPSREKAVHANQQKMLSPSGHDTGLTKHPPFW